MTEQGRGTELTELIFDELSDHSFRPVGYISPGGVGHTPPDAPRSRRWVRVRQRRHNIFVAMFLGNPNQWTVEAFLVYEKLDRTTHSEWLTIHTTSDRVEALNWAHRWTERNRKALAKQREDEQRRRLSL